MASHHSVPSGNSLDSGGAPSGGGHSSGAPASSAHLVTPSCNSSSVVVLSPSKMREEEKRLQMVSFKINQSISRLQWLSEQMECGNLQIGKPAVAL